MKNEMDENDKGCGASPGASSLVFLYPNVGYKIEIDKKGGTAMIRDLDGHAIHAAHVLNLVRIDSVIAHEREKEA